MKNEKYGEKEQFLGDMIMKPKNQNQKLLVTGNAKGVLPNLPWRLMMLQDEKLRKQKVKVKVNFFKRKS